MHNDWEQGLLIPRDISWQAIEGHGFRVERFLPLASMEKGKIKEVVKYMPYAGLFVESPFFDKLGMEASATRIITVLHKVDFRHFWELYKERGVDEKEEEVIVSYFPSQSGIRKLLGTHAWPHLRIDVRPKGSLEQVYRMDEISTEEWLEMTERISTIAQWLPMEGRTK